MLLGTGKPDINALNINELLDLFIHLFIYWALIPSQSWDSQQFKNKIK